MNKKDNNFYDLVNYIELLIQNEKNINPDIKYLDVTHSKLIAQIISNYNLQNNKNINPENPIMIFLGAPTGAGKDILVRKIMSENKEKSFVVLNMDIFRYYHNEISKNHEYISDKNFAKTTNQTSYELYYIIQKIILEKYPNTNVIVTGTIRDLNWVKNIIKTYKDNNLSHYQISLVTLAVPIVESAFSIYERYLTLVSARGNSNSPLRYTELEYHNDTVKEFIQTMHDQVTVPAGIVHIAPAVVVPNGHDFFQSPLPSQCLQHFFHRCLLAVNLQIGVARIVV